MDNQQSTPEATIQDLFRLNVAAQAVIFHEGLAALETQTQSTQTLESLAKAAHEVKGVAAIAEIDAAVSLAHLLEDYFITIQNLGLTLGLAQVNTLRNAVQALVRVSQAPEVALHQWLTDHQPEIDTITQEIASLLTGSGEQGSQGVREQGGKEAREHKSEAEIVLSEVAIAETPSPLLPTASSTVRLSTHIEVYTPPPPPLPLSYEPVTISDPSMLDLFRQEVEAQANILNEGLLSLESQPQSARALESLMRAAHSIKGAARIVAIDAAVTLAHVMEDCFVAAQKHTVTLGAEDVDILLQGVDLLFGISQLEPDELNPWFSSNQSQIAITRQQIAAILTGEKAPAQSTATQSPQTEAGAITPLPVETISLVKPNGSSVSDLTNSASSGQSNTQIVTTSDRVVRVNAENLNRIMGLAGESLIEANWLQPFADSLMALKKQQLQLSKILQEFQEAVAVGQYQNSHKFLKAARSKELECRQILGDRLDSLELFARRTANLSDRLYREVIASNMRPFADGVQGFPRMIRDLARKLDKQIKFDIYGKSTPVDRDILKKLEAPLTHILRNSVDHGIEAPSDRLAADKPAEGTVRLEAVHRSGMLSITISDDGRGIDYDWLRRKILDKKLATPEMVEQLDESELMEFLFLPGFSTAKQVTEISGRGVGLDIAKSMAQEVGGNVRAFSTSGKGITFYFQLPLTLSVVRTLLVEISGEAYAFPLARIEQILMVKRSQIRLIENRQYFTMDDKNIGLVSAYQVLQLPQSIPDSEALPVVVIGEQPDYYGLVVDKFLGEHDLVVRPLDHRLGKVQDISAAALMGDGSPVLIVDVSDLIRSVDNLLNSSQLSHLSKETAGNVLKGRKSILVVDDSITVREMERKLLENRGYKVDVAVDGMEGWHTISSKRYDLVISDIDMPRMNGIELVSRIKANPELSSIPVIIVSYKDREEDRLQGLEAGANYYLTKASFQDDTLVKAVLDLIGN